MKTAILLLCLVDLVEVAASLARFPAVGLASAAAVLAMLTLYGLATWFAWERSGPEVQRWATRLGAAGGLVLAGEVVLEYLLLPADNTPFGLVEYGFFLALLVASGVLAYLETHNLKNSALAGLWSGMIASLAWYGMALLVFHLFFGSPQQAQVMRAEGNLEDFARSGMKDFTAFVVQDFFGAGFFHLLLGAGLGALMGLVGGLAGRLAGIERHSEQPNKCR